MATAKAFTRKDNLSRDILLNKRGEAGLYKVLFNAGGLASGIYFHKLRGGFKDVIKKDGHRAVTGALKTITEERDESR